MKDRFLPPGSVKAETMLSTSGKSYEVWLCTPGRIPPHYARSTDSYTKTVWRNQVADGEYDGSAPDDYYGMRTIVNNSWVLFDGETQPINALGEVAL